MENGLPLCVGIVGDEASRYINGDYLLPDLESPWQSLAIHGMPQYHATVPTKILRTFWTAVLSEIGGGGAQD